MLPETQNTFTEARFLSFANEEMDLAVLPLLLGFHEDYFLHSVDIAIEDDKSRYKIPERATGNKLRELAFKDNSDALYEMTRIVIEDAPYYQFGQIGATGTLKVFYIENDEVVLVPEVQNTQGSLRMTYYLRPNTIVSESRVATINADPNFSTGVLSVSSIPSVLTDGLANGLTLDILKTKSPHITHNICVTPTSTNTTSLEFKFGTANIQNLQFPAQASMSDQDYWIYSDANSGEKTAFWYNVSGTATAPTIAGITTFIEVDISGDTTGTDVATTTASAISLTDITVTQSTDTLTITNTTLVGNNFSIDTASGAANITRTVTQTGAKVLVEDIQRGDYIALEEECIIPQIPTEAHSLLAQRVAARCLEALGDTEGLQAANAKIAEMEQKLGSVVDTRVEGAPLKIYSRHGFIRNTRKYFRR